MTKLELPFIDLNECGAFAHRDWTQSHNTAMSNIMWKNKKGRPRGSSVANIKDMGFQTAALQVVLCGRICELCLYYKNITIILVDIPFIVIFPVAALEPAHNNGCGLWP